MNVNLGAEEYRATALVLERAGGGQFGPCAPRMEQWCEAKQLPQALISLFRDLCPLSEAWAGAGALFAQDTIIDVNEAFPEAVANDLLIVGSAPNGDQICLDLLGGKVGYLNHEAPWQTQPKDCFIAIAPTLGAFLAGINENPPRLPEDYFAATLRS